MNRSRYAESRKLLETEHPDVVFTHWPVDSHRDQRAVSYLVYDAWLKGGKEFDLYYFDVDQGGQSIVCSGALCRVASASACRSGHSYSITGHKVS